MRLSIDQLPSDEILRYLGYHGTEIPDALQKLIEDCIILTLQTITPQSIYHRFSILRTEAGIAVNGTNLILKGQSIQNHLRDSAEIFLIAVTIGAAMDKLIRIKMLTASEEGVILDSCATTAVETAADLTETIIRDECNKRGESITWRFSPGYGDLPIETQRDFLPVLDTPRKIGLMVSSNLILTPLKSVTAVIGVTGEKTKALRNPCDDCYNSEFCEFKKAGLQCSK